MLFLLPVILFSLTALGIVWLRLRVTRMAYIWLIITLMVSVSWIIFMILPVLTISTAFTLQWVTLPDSVVQLQFGLIPMTWGFTLLLISLALGYLLICLFGFVITLPGSLWAKITFSIFVFAYSFYYVSKRRDINLQNVLPM